MIRSPIATGFDDGAIPPQPCPLLREGRPLNLRGLTAMSIEN
jgi:hypothetical protein